MYFRVRFSLRLLVAAVTVVCIVFGIWTHRSREQRRIVAQIRKNGGWVRYDFQLNANGQPGTNPISKTVRNWLGEDYYRQVVEVETLSAMDLAELPRFRNIECLHINSSTLTDAEFLPVAHLQKLKGIDIYGDGAGPYSRIGDLSMELLAKLPVLELVNIESSQITSEGLAKLAASSSLRKLYAASPDMSINEQAADPLRERLSHFTLRRSLPGAGFGEIVTMWQGGSPPGPKPIGLSLPAQSE